MAKDIFDTIIEKGFHQLTSNELAEMAEFCSNEQEFLAMKKVLLHSKAVADGPKLAPKEATKEKLDNLFDATHGKSRKFVPFYLNPLIQIAAVIAIGFAVWMFLPSTEKITPNQLAENTPPQKDEKTKKSKEEEVSIKKDDEAFDAIGNTNEVKLKKDTYPEIEPNISENEMVPEYTAAYKNRYDEGMIETPVLIEEVIAKSSNEANSNADLNTKVESKSRSFHSVSTPATSVNDISIVSDKKMVQQTLSSMNVSEQKNVLKYLESRY